MPVGYSIVNVAKYYRRVLYWLYGFGINCNHMYFLNVDDDNANAYFYHSQNLLFTSYGWNQADLRLYPAENKKK